MMMMMMNTTVRVLTAESLDLLTCAIDVATFRIVNDAGATCHIIASVVDSTF